MRLLFVVGDGSKCGVQTPGALCVAEIKLYNVPRKIKADEIFRIVKIVFRVSNTGREWGWWWWGGMGMDQFILRMFVSFEMIIMLDCPTIGNRE